jgi:hypothetical protein
MEASATAPLPGNMRAGMLERTEKVGGRLTNRNGHRLKSQIKNDKGASRREPIQNCEVDSTQGRTLAFGPLLLFL